MVQMVYQPIITAMYFEYEAAGCHIYYGLARGLGSVGFAVTSFFTGRAIGKFGVNILMILDIIFLTIALIVLYFFKKPKTETPKIEKNEVAHNNLFSFIKTYPGFMLFVLAAVCFFLRNSALISMNKSSRVVDYQFFLEHFSASIASTNINAQSASFGLTTSIT